MRNRDSARVRTDDRGWIPNKKQPLGPLYPSANLYPSTNLYPKS